MKTIKTADLTGAALDWAVAKCEGRTPTLNMNSHGRVWHGWWLVTGGEYERMPNYSTNWAQGGPIIDREKIGPTWSVLWQQWVVPHPRSAALGLLGPTPLIAAMRCYVASKLGDSVEIPEGLLE